MFPILAPAEGAVTNAPCLVISGAAMSSFDVALFDDHGEQDGDAHSSGKSDNCEH
jgi:hypothetical protein